MNTLGFLAFLYLKSDALQIVSQYQLKTKMLLVEVHMCVCMQVGLLLRAS